MESESVLQRTLLSSLNHTHCYSLTSNLRGLCVDETSWDLWAVERAAADLLIL